MSWCICKCDTTELNLQRYIEVNSSVMLNVCIHLCVVFRKPLVWLFHRTGAEPQDWKLWPQVFLWAQAWSHRLGEFISSNHMTLKTSSLNGRTIQTDVRKWTCLLNHSFSLSSGVHVIMSFLCSQFTDKIYRCHVWPTGGDVALSEFTTQFVAVLYHYEASENHFLLLTWPTRTFWHSHWYLCLHLQSQQDEIKDFKWKPKQCSWELPQGPRHTSKKQISGDN